MEQKKRRVTKETKISTCTLEIWFAQLVDNHKGGWVGGSVATLTHSAADEIILAFFKLLLLSIYIFIFTELMMNLSAQKKKV